jgi:hypothetical protein
MFTMCGWFKAEAVFASRSKRAARVLVVALAPTPTSFEPPRRGRAARSRARWDRAHSGRLPRPSQRRSRLGSEPIDQARGGARPRRGGTRGRRGSEEGARHWRPAFSSGRARRPFSVGDAASTRRRGTHRASSGWSAARPPLNKSHRPASQRSGRHPRSQPVQPALAPSARRGFKRRRHGHAQDVSGVSRGSARRRKAQARPCAPSRDRARPTLEKRLASAQTESSSRAPGGRRDVFRERDPKTRIPVRAARARTLARVVHQGRRRIVSARQPRTA